MTFIQVERILWRMCKSSFDPDPPIKPLPEPVQCNPKKKEKTMYFDIDGDNNEANQRNYLTSRLNTIKTTKYSDLERKFGLRGDRDPSTPEELINRIKEGKYKVDEKNMKRSAYSPVTLFTWKDPSVKEDHEGFEKARKRLDELYTQAYDNVIVDDVKSALTAVQKFEEKTIH